jgi:hypothetical protein
MTREQLTRAAEPAKAGPLIGPPQPAPHTEPRSGEPHRAAAVNGWRATGWVAAGVATGLVIVWVILFSGWQVGSKAQWLTGAGVILAVALALWQTLHLQRQANRDAAQAAERLRMELAAAAARSAEELAHARELHWVEMEAQRKLHAVEMETQRKLAHTQRTQLLEQQQKQAIIEVSRAVSAHTYALATLWNQAASILRLKDRDKREQAMDPIFEQIGQVVNDFSVELANAHLLTEDDRLHAALNRVNDAALMAIEVAEEMHTAVVEGEAPESNPIPSIQRLMQQRTAEARHLAWELLRSSLNPG